MKRPYCCDDSRKLYETYYDRQQNGSGDFPVYVGRRNQRGHGIGNMLGSLFRRILPILKAAMPHVLRTGANVIEDVASGKTWKQSAIKRIPEGLKDIKVANETALANSEQTGSGRQKRRKKDIFDGFHSRRKLRVRQK